MPSAARPTTVASARVGGAQHGVELCAPRRAPAQPRARPNADRHAGAPRDRRRLPVRRSCPCPHPRIVCATAAACVSAASPDSCASSPPCPARQATSRASSSGCRAVTISAVSRRPPGPRSSHTSQWRCTQKRAHADFGCENHAERPERPDQQPRQVIAVLIVSARAGSGAHDRPVALRHGNADDLIAYRPVAVTERPGVGGCDDAADGRGSALAQPELRVDREHQPFAREQRLRPDQRRPGIDRRGEIIRRYDHAIEVAGLQLQRAGWCRRHPNRASCRRR